ncbi:hypothetical protein RI129_013263 [Pyrocoelia pectoralis]|uniref:Fatty acyl-CoA reductase n=1 Tax=Pyrocoelia pectoralis TaxID=417401 RepID=A0AAN7V1J2_9COLE
MNGASNICDYFKQKTVLITGATGFVGKLLVEKILRTCDVNKMYVTMRPKKNKSIYQRMEEYFENPIINADIGLPNLGISETDRKMIIEEVNIVFHSAATTRFDETLRIASYVNVRGTLEMMKLCTEMENLRVSVVLVEDIPNYLLFQSVVHVSTAYSFCVQSKIEEKCYKSHLQGADLLNIVDTLDDEKLDVIKPLLLKQWPNTYVFTKSIAENVVWEYYDILPIGMVRPSIITATVCDPVPGWVDNLIGATGVFVGTLLGVIRTMKCRSDYIADLVPADHVVNCMIATATMVHKNRENQNEGRGIYNCITSCQRPLTWGECSAFGAKHADKIPSTMAIWSVIFLPSSHSYLYLLLHFILHVVPAYVIDFFCICVGKKPQLVKGYQKIAKLLNVIGYFATRQWNFSNSNTQELWASLSDHDKERYNFDAGSIDWNTYFYHYVYGGRIYLLKEPLDTVPQARIKQRKLKITHYTLMIIITMFLAYSAKCICSGLLMNL